MANFNGREPASHCWCWADEGGTPKYIGWGSLNADGQPPWQQLWDQRERQPGQLGDWLRSLDAQPALDWSRCPTSAMPASAAAALAKLLRRLAGVELLRNRVYRGAGPRRPCLGYRSVTAAAAALGVSRRQICRLCGFPGYSDRPAPKKDPGP
jgi:hypothetical protein